MKPLHLRLLLSIQHSTFNISFPPGFWLRLQLDYDLMRAERENGERVQREFQLGWNRKVVDRRPEVAALVKALRGKNRH